MSSFTEARLERVCGLYRQGRPVFRVRGAEGNGLWFYIGHPNSRQGLHVREGFLSDGASYLTGRQRRWARRLGLGALIDWIDDCLAPGALIHDGVREDMQFSLLESDCYFLVAMAADMPRWKGPHWAKLTLRGLAFIAVRFNRYRIQHNAALA